LVSKINLGFICGIFNITIPLSNSYEVTEVAAWGKWTTGWDWKF